MSSLQLDKIVQSGDNSREMHRTLLISFLIILLTCLAGVSLALAAVTLIYKTATPYHGVVRVQWETSSEVDTAGFYVNRSLQRDGIYDHISSFIPSQGNASSGAIYVFTDTNVITGTVYFYTLEIWDTHSGLEVTDPFSTTLSSLAPTPSRTPTRTPVRSPTPGIATQTSTVNPLFSGTPTLPGAGPLTPGPTSTSTLGPLSSSGQMFPDFTQTATFTASPTPTHKPAPANAPPATANPPVIGLLGGLAFLFWLLLGAALVFYLRRLGY